MVLLSWLKNRFKIAQELSFGDWLIITEAWWGLLAYYFAVRTVSFERLNRSDLVAETQANEAIIKKALHIHRLVYLASRLHILSMTCLPRTLALRWVLRRRGMPAKVKIGVTKSQHGFQAHAWLELNGQQVGETEKVTERFRTFNFQGD